MGKKTEKTVYKPSGPAVMVTCNCCQGKGTVRLSVPHQKCLEAIKMICLANPSATIAAIHKLSGKGRTHAATNKRVERLLQWGVVVKAAGTTWPIQVVPA